jgi:diguanylate cyclase (GGDEF)-like protein
MLELQEQQHKRVVMLSSAALVFSAFASWELIRELASTRLPDQSRLIYLMSCIVVISAVILVTMYRSFQDFHASRKGHLFDSATGLASRAGFEHSLRQEILKLRPGEGLAILLADIRRFKSLNQSFGHQAGDSIINAVAFRLSQTAYSDILLAHLEGGRFAFIIRAPSKAAVTSFASMVQRAMVPPFLINERNIFVDLSLGSVHLVETDRTDFREAMRRAEFALLEAKAGNGAHVCYSDVSALTARRVSAIETDLRETLETAEIDIYFQPLVDWRFDKIVAVEALARWTHPQYGRVSPNDFVSMAESLGLDSKMGLSILRRACRMIGPMHDVHLAVNISPRHFQTQEFPHDVKSILEQTGFPAHRLEIEITENILLSDNQQSHDAIAAVRALGVSVVLDDFGTGYSGLSYLNRFNVDRIKIDATFVRGIENSATAQSIVSNIMSIARERKIKVTVEGVETVDQVLYLRRFGDLWYQGFLFARPMPFEQLINCASFSEFSGSFIESHPQAGKPQ